MCCMRDALQPGTGTSCSASTMLGGYPGWPGVVRGRGLLSTCDVADTWWWRVVPEGRVGGVTECWEGCIVGQAPRELAPLESALDFFGAQLRHWRTLRTLSQVALGQRTHDSGALISKIEKGERFPSLALTRRLDAALKTGGALERLWPQVERERATRDVASDRLAGGDESVPDDLGLAWPATPDATVEVVAQLWRTDLDRRSALVSAAWSSTGQGCRISEPSTAASWLGKSSS
ncbi:MAG: helix-turn-helix domain-containing protein [Pseudonocardiaceae bacterium]